jgi:hypothetical protein
MPQSQIAGLVLGTSHGKKTRLDSPEIALDAAPPRVRTQEH